MKSDTCNHANEAVSFECYRWYCLSAMINYLPELHDMRCKAQRICEIIRGRYHRDPMNGDVYMFMSKDQRKVRMIHYERNAYYLHEKSFIKGYKFMKIERKDDVTVYKIDWKDLVTILETPVITSIRI